ncbi:MAG: chromosome segregation protein SMC [Burkholderiales bacterium]|nr:chromosome segregation protein SMC [Burkholderiales bacterium]
MRLTHIKLAGFKSFVDPTHVAVPGQLTGIVGPNGCGKSNVIDAVRWVLGESSARNLRGETLQDVLFNGSGDRRPVNRASVELVFDNSQGRAAGAWSTYAEISIRRVLERDGQSDYYINNLAVRRKDVADIFLGTGVGARGYAIIEQGMISRIVEARPEELRAFLEEAAGVSKYRERRKETESRLDDTRDNLLRVDDIRRELATQIEKLDSQAQAAEQWRALDGRLHEAQHLLWYVRRTDARSQRERIAREIDERTLELEATTAQLRETETRAVQLREAQYAASEAVHVAQGALYEVSGEAARAQQALEFLHDNRQRAAQRREQALREQGEQAQRRAVLEESLQATTAERDEAALQAEACESALDAVRDELPAADAAWQAARATADLARQQAAEARTRRDVATVALANADKLLSQLQSRAVRLDDEAAALEAPDPVAVEALTEAREAAAAAAAESQAAIASLEARFTDLDRRHGDLRQQAERVRQDVTAQETRLDTLIAFQQRLRATEEMAAWLGQHGLADAARLWERVHIEAGWQDAFESVLRERLNALPIDAPERLADWFGAAPPGKLTVFRPGTSTFGLGLAPSGCGRLLDRLRMDDATVGAVLADWLGHVFTADSLDDALRVATSLDAHQCVVTREGHVFTARSVGFHAPDSELHGLLARKREIEALEAAVPMLRETLDRLRGEAEAAALAREDTRRALAAARETGQAHVAQRHRLELDELRARESLERLRTRAAQLSEERARVAAEIEHEQGARLSLFDAVAEAQSDVEALQESTDAAVDVARAAEQQLVLAREHVQRADREAQNAAFQARSLDARVGDLEANLADLAARQSGAARALADIDAELAGFDDAPLRERLAQALERKADREHALGTRRDALADAERDLREAEQARMALEQQLGPLRERLHELDLKAQEARLAEENFAQQLFEAQAEEAALAEAARDAPRPQALQAEINRLQAEIVGLGPVNLAALQELDTAQQRKGFLDAQSTDLAEAIDTLVEAIRRIDRETRERLRTTFDDVNRHFGEYFATLFRGGEAKLVMTGDEILDSGVQISARPPGKKNQSIQMLSGGEKALTAMALVFAMFKLNPAPFCLLDEVDAPLDESNAGRMAELVRSMATETQFVFITHNKTTMEVAEHLIGVTMPEPGVSRVVAVDIEEALRITDARAAA